MASATFTLRAVDQTQAAFASVQNSLGRLQNTANVAGRSLTKNLDVKDVFRSLAMAVGLSADKIANKIAELVTGQDEETKKLQDSLTSLGEEAVKAQRALLEATSTDEQNVKRLIVERERLRAIIEEPAGGNLEKQVKQQEAIVKLYETETALVRHSKEEAEKLKKNQLELRDAHIVRLKAESELYRAQSGGLTNQEKMDSLLWKEEVFRKRIKEINDEEIDNYEERIQLENDLAKALMDQIPIVEESRKFGMEFGDAIANSFEDAILSGTKLREVLRALGQDLLRLIFREQITKPMAAGLGNFFADLFTGKATGGPVSGGTPYMVGEKGPELFVPGSSGSIVPNHRLSSEGGGGSPVIVNYHIAAGVTRSELVPILETERKRLKAEIPDMVRRGGAYRAAFA